MTNPLIKACSNYLSQEGVKHPFFDLHQNGSENLFSELSNEPNALVAGQGLWKLTRSTHEETSLKAYALLLKRLSVHNVGRIQIDQLIKLEEQIGGELSNIISEQSTSEDKICLGLFCYSTLLEHMLLLTCAEYSHNSEWLKGHLSVMSNRSQPWNNFLKEEINLELVNDIEHLLGSMSAFPYERVSMPVEFSKTKENSYIPTIYSNLIIHYQSPGFMVLPTGKARESQYALMDIFGQFISEFVDRVALKEKMEMPSDNVKDIFGHFISTLVHRVALEEKVEEPEKDGMRLSKNAVMTVFCQFINDLVDRKVPLDLDPILSLAKRASEEFLPDLERISNLAKRIHEGFLPDLKRKHTYMGILDDLRKEDIKGFLIHHGYGLSSSSCTDFVRLWPEICKSEGNRCFDLPNDGVFHLEVHAVEAGESGYELGKLFNEGNTKREILHTNALKLVLKLLKKEKRFENFSAEVICSSDSLYPVSPDKPVMFAKLVLFNAPCCFNIYYMRKKEAKPPVLREVNIEGYYYHHRLK